MSNTVNVSLDEIRDFQDGLRHLADDIDHNISVLYDVFGNVSDRLEAAINNLEVSKKNADHDIIVLDGLYRVNEIDINKRQARADAVAQTQGTSAPRIDDSVLKAIDNDRSALRSLSGQLLNNLSTYRSALSAIKSSFESTVKFLKAAVEAVREFSIQVSRAYEYVEKAMINLSFGESYYFNAQIYVSDIGVLLQGASRISDYAQRTSSSSTDVSLAVENFSDMLDDDVSRASREAVSDMSEQISNLARFYRTAAESLKSGYYNLRSYLSLA